MVTKQLLSGGKRTFSVTAATLANDCQSGRLQPKIVNQISQILS